MNSAKMVRGKVTWAAGLSIGLLTAGLAHAQPSAADIASFPNKPIRIIVPFAAGAINDTLARAIGEKLGEEIKQTVLIENRAGGGTVIGTDHVAKAAPDGYTLLQVSPAHAINVSLVGKLPYDSMRSFSFITLTAKAPTLMLVNASSSYKSVRDVIADAKARSGKLSFSSTGNGGLAHLTGEMLKSAAGVDIVHVPYKGAAPAVVDLVGGQVHFTFTTVTGAASFVKSGRVRAIAVTSMKRMAILPDLPAIAEAGYPGFDAVGWWGFAAPAGTPPAIVDKLNRELNKVLSSAAVRDRFKSQGVEIGGSTPAVFTNYVQSEIETWTKVVKASGAKAG